MEDCHACGVPLDDDALRCPACDAPVALGSGIVTNLTRGPWGWVGIVVAVVVLYLWLL